jgi:quinol monooxygenase YgiN
MQPMVAVRKVSFALFLIVAAAAPGNTAEPDIPVTNENGETALFIDIEIKPGTESAFETAVLKSVKCSRFEPGNITFNIHKIYHDERKYMLYEVWRTPEHFKAHLDRPYTKALMDTLAVTMVQPLDASLHFAGDFAPAPRMEPGIAEPSKVDECK